MSANASNTQTAEPKLKRSYLVQRLKIPHTPNFPKRKWDLTKDGTVSQKMIEMRQGVCEYDYMGSSEFEFGAIPDAIRMVMNKRCYLTPFSMAIKGDSVIKPWKDHQHAYPTDIPIYVLCSEAEKEEIQDRIKELFTEPAQKNLKELLFYPPLAVNDEMFAVRGWFELNNGFYFFTSREMWQGMTMLYTGKKPE